MQGRVIQTSSWVVKGLPAGINFREGKEGTDFADKNPFLPHKIVKMRPDENDHYEYRFLLNLEQLKIRLELYKHDNKLKII